MVNTRRSESIGTTPELTSTHRSRPPIVDGSDSSSVSPSEESQSEDNSWESKPLSKRQTRNGSARLGAKVRELRSRFVQRRHSVSVRSATSKRLSINDRDRHTLSVYSSRNMYNGDESDDAVYERKSRRSRHSRHQQDRMERRTALSLRPISQKCYTDLQSDNDLRRSTRKRKVRYEHTSWLGDDQMHKIGYPNLYTTGYSEEDSRDAPTMAESRQSTRQMSENKRRETKSPKYLYNYETNELPARRCRTEITLKRKRRESNDKENNEECVNNNTNDEDDLSLNLRINGGVSLKKDESVESIDQVNDEEKKEEIDAINEESNKKEESSESDIGGTTRRAANKIVLNNRYRQPNKNRKRYGVSSSSESGPRKSYSLRTRAPKPSPISKKSGLRNHEHQPRPRKRFQRRRESSSSSSSTSSNDLLQKKTPKNQHSKNEKMKTGADSSKIAPIAPETLDSTIRFSSIGGLDSHIQCLKEMIILPMMYPEVFRQFQIQPPRGVLFHGPPGTGKTLIARALANECTRLSNSRKVSFFMRKGADLLSKWIGESEKQLRLLFQQASEMAPSIIFFDELDGLAPVRSSRQDQIHASIVSTLLALMDGLDNRGEVIVIGATNRIDAIDPALRRPGRFDRELFFPLPAKTEREAILNVHLSQWNPPPSVDLVSYLAETAVGYCGSDLRALCSEGVIQAFRRTYPQVYNADYRLMLDSGQVKVEKIDFLRAKSLLVPASQRICHNLGRKLMVVLEPLLNGALEGAFGLLKDAFPHGLNPALSKVKITPNIRPAQLLIVAENADCGQTNHLAPAILYKMEHISAYILDLAALYRESGRSAEETVIQVFNEARRNIPSVIYIPNIDNWWCLMNPTVKFILTSQLAQLDPNIPILLLATADKTYENLSDEIQNIFSRYRNEVLHVKTPTSDERVQFFKRLVIDACLKPPKPSRQRVKSPPPLPKARTPSPTPLTEEQAKKLYEHEEHTLRELRIFLRDICKKLANNKLFYMFTKPVDTEEVPDYTEIIKQPMDLETMMTKVDFHRYACAKDFLNDIELICQNALEYNPAKTSADKQIRHRACSLYDYAYTLIKNEMDTDFEDKCQGIAKERHKRKVSVQKYLPAYITAPGRNAPIEEAAVAMDVGVELVQEVAEKVEEKNDGKVVTFTKKRRSASSWQRGCLKKRKKKEKSADVNMEQEIVSDDDSKESAKLEPVELNENSAQITLETTIPLTINCSETNHIEKEASISPKRRLSNLMSPSELLENQLDFDDIDQALHENMDEKMEVRTVECSTTRLNEVLNACVLVTNGCSLQLLLDFYNQLDGIVKKYSNSHQRTDLPKDLLRETIRFREEYSIDVSERSSSGDESEK